MAESIFGYSVRGYVQKKHAVQASIASDPGTVGATVFAGRGHDGSGYYIIVGLMRFDTAAIPDTDTILSATLTFKVSTLLSNISAFQLMGEWYDPGASIDASDWSQTPSSTAFAGVQASALSTSVSTVLSLTNLTSINKTGFTGIRLHYSNDIMSGNNYLALDGAAPMMLTITHAPPDGPIRSSMFMAM